MQGMAEFELEVGDVLSCKCIDYFSNIRVGEDGERHGFGEVLA